MGTGAHPPGARARARACTHFTHHVHSARWDGAPDMKTLAGPLTATLAADSFYWRHSPLRRKYLLAGISSRVG